MKPINMFFAAILSLLLFSSKKQDQPAPVPGTEQKLLKKISTSPQEFDFFYTNGRIDNTKNYTENNRLISTDDPQDNAQGQLISIT